MNVAVYDEADELFAHLVVTVARRRGHTARQVNELEQIRLTFPSPPGAITVGVGRVDGGVIDRLADLRGRYEDAVLYLLAEEVDSGVTISALEAGVTDVLHKPVLPRELVIRAERAYPTHAGGRPEGAIRVADLEVDLDQVRAVKAGQELTLTRMELRLLYCLMQHYGRVTPTDRLVTFGWESDEMATSSLKTHISHLRQKLREAGGVPLRISARQMLGYILEGAGDEQSQANEAATS